MIWHHYSTFPRYFIVHIQVKRLLMLYVYACLHVCMHAFVRFWFCCSGRIPRLSLNQHSLYVGVVEKPPPPPPLTGEQYVPFICLYTDPSTYRLSLTEACSNQITQGRLRGITVAWWVTDHYHPGSNLGVSISEGCFIFGGRSFHLACRVHKSGRKTQIIIII